MPEAAHGSSVRLLLRQSLDIKPKYHGTNDFRDNGMMMLVGTKDKFIQVSNE